MIGELLMLVLKFNFGETNRAINMNKIRVAMEAAKYLFKLFFNLIGYGSNGRL